jgi:hypothetical protein
MPTVYRIHPSIGIARIGNSRTESFDGPDVPDIHFIPPGGTFRDATGRIRRQAVKFRVFEFVYDDAVPTKLKAVRLLTQDDATIRWTVHMANTKSFTEPGGVHTSVPNDPGPKSVDSDNPAVNVVGRIFNTDVLLGTLEAFDASTLRVLGGFGESGPPGTPQGTGLHWAGWFDDVADGPVQAAVTLKDGTKPPVVPAWVVSGVPKFATPVTPIVTMYDAAYDIAVRHFAHTHPTDVDFTRDIFPVLHRAVMFQWVEAASRQGHGAGQPGDFLDSSILALLSDPNPDPATPAGAARLNVFTRLKNPSGGDTSTMSMPRLIGPASAETPKANGLSLTPTQYETFRRWSLGDFKGGWNGIPMPVPFEKLAPERQPEALDRASLDTGVGGTYGPGIEVGRHFGELATFEAGLRVHCTKPAGYLTSTLSIPWPVDYQACGAGWWPAARPNRVMQSDHTFGNWARFTGTDTMLTAWSKLAFIKRGSHQGATVYLETEQP